MNFPPGIARSEVTNFEIVGLDSPLDSPTELGTMVGRTIAIEEQLVLPGLFLVISFGELGRSVQIKWWKCIRD